MKKENETQVSRISFTESLMTGMRTRPVLGLAGNGLSFIIAGTGVVQLKFGDERGAITALALAGGITFTVLGSSYLNGRAILRRQKR